MVTKATHDQLRLRISPKTGKCMVIANRAAIPLPGRELLQQEEHQFVKNLGLSYCHLERRGNLDVLHVTIHIRVLSSTGPPASNTASNRYDLEGHHHACVPACGSFPGGGILQHTSNHFLSPSGSQAPVFSCHPCNCCHIPPSATWTMI